MKINSLFAFISFTIILNACSTKSSYDAVNNFDKIAEEKFLFKIMPLIAQRAPYSNDTTRFESRFDEHYKNELVKFDLISYQQQPDSSACFLIYKVAPSLKVKKIAIGGKIKIVNDSIVEFEEVFNTPKMELKELDSKSSELFNELATQGNVKKYLGNADMIEFPDSRTCYDKAKLKWRFISEAN